MKAHARQTGRTVARKGNQLTFTPPRLTCRFTKKVMLRDVPALVTFVPGSLELRQHCPVAQFQMLLPDGGHLIRLEQDNVRGGLISMLRIMRQGRPLDEVHVQVLGDVLVDGFKALQRDIDALNRFKWQGMWLDLPLKLRGQDFHFKVRLDTDYPVDLNPLGFFLEGVVDAETDYSVLMLRARQEGAGMAVSIADPSYLPEFIAHCVSVDASEITEQEVAELMRQLMELGPVITMQAENNATLIRHVAAGRFKHIGSVPPEVDGIDSRHNETLNPRCAVVPNPFFDSSLAAEACA
jgi:hypothetical protein